jgi:hypothetical protein
MLHTIISHQSANKKKEQQDNMAQSTTLPMPHHDATRPISAITSSSALTVATALTNDKTNQPSNHNDNNNNNNNNNNFNNNLGRKRPRSNHNNNNNEDDPSDRRQLHPKHHHNNNKNNRNHKRNKNKNGSMTAKSTAQTASLPCCSVCHLTSADDDTVCATKYKCPKCLAFYCSVACCKQHKEVCPKQQQPLPPPPSSSSTLQDKEEGTEGLNQEPTALLAAITKSKYLIRPAFNVELGNDSDVPDQTGANVNQKNEDNDDSSSSSSEEEEEGWTITEHMKCAMDRSDWLQKELADGGLQHIIHKIVTASNLVPHHHKAHHKNKNDGDYDRTPQEEELERAKERYPNFELFLDKFLVLTGVLERQDDDQEPSMTTTTMTTRTSLTTITNDSEVDTTTETAKHGGSTIVDGGRAMEEWLKEPHSREELQQCLRLRPIVRPRRPPAVTEWKVPSPILPSSSSSDVSSASSGEEDDSSEEEEEDD